MLKRSLKKSGLITITFLVLLFVLMCFPTHASAADVVASGYCGGDTTAEYDSSIGWGDLDLYKNLSWMFDSEGTLTISGAGLMADFGDCDWVAPWWNLEVKKIIINPGVTNIGAWAFWMSDTTDVTIPNSVTNIGAYAFSNCENITSISIPGSVINIDNSVFYGCGKLNSIIISEDNTNYSDLGGVLFSKDKKSLILYPEGKTDDLYCIPNGVTAIKHAAFFNCSNLKNVTIPDSVTVIESAAFGYCSKLNNVTIPNNITIIESCSFEDCDSLTDITIPNSVTCIKGDAFARCKSLTSITIPSGVNSIGDGAFYYCDSLRSITISNSITSIEYYAFYGCTSLTDVYYLGTEKDWNAIDISDGNECLTDANIHFNSVQDDEPEIIASGYCGGDTTAEYDSESGCYKNLSWTLDNEGTLMISGVGKMVDYTYSEAPWYKAPTYTDGTHYYDNNTVKSVVINEGVESIGQGAFLRCTKLVDVNMSDSVKSIGGGAFSHCTVLKNINISNNVTLIDDEVFCCCESLKSIKLPDSITHIGEWVFYDCIALSSITIPSCVTKIDSFAFYKCYSLKSVNIPDGVMLIASSAFEDCTSLTNINLPDSIVEIGLEAFKNCKSLLSIEIPDGVKKIGLDTFYGCKNLTDVYYLGTEEQWNAISIGSDNDCLTNATIHFQVNSSSSSLLTTESVSGIIRRDNGCKLVWKMDYAIDETGQKKNCKLSIVLGGKNAFGEMMLYSTENGGVMPWLTDEYGFDKDSIVYLSVSGTQENPIRITTELFMEYENLSDVTLNNVSGIDSMAFKNCLKLSSVQFSGSNSVLTIGASAFENDKCLTSITLPANLTYIGDKAFYGTSLGTVYIPQNTVSIADDSFGGSTKAVKIKCFAGSYAQSYATEHGFATELVSKTTDGKIRLFYNNDQYVDFTKSLDDFISCDSTVYNRELAYYLAVLANAAYNESNVVEDFTALGMMDLIHPNYNVSDDSTVAYCVGKKTAADGTTIVLIDVRGTIGSKEWLSNLTLGVDSTLVAGKHYGFYTCAELVHNSVKNLLGGNIQTSDVKYFVTGHSRGAAVANLLSDMFYQDGVSKYDVYDYNFACPDVARGPAWDWNPNGVHDNMFNIGNAADIVSLVPGKVVNILLGLDKTGITTAWGKYGKSMWYSENWDSMSNTTLDITFAAHDMTKYMNEIKNVNEADFKDYMGWKLKAAANAANSTMKMFAILCPVDVEVLDADENVVAAVRGDTADYSDSIIGEVMIMVCGDQKAVLINNTNKYKVVLTATGDGEMTYSVKDINIYSDDVSSEAEFNNVTLQTGGKMISFTGSETPAEQSRLFIADEQETLTQEIQNNGEEISISTETYRILGGSITKESDRLCIQACIENNADEEISGTVVAAFYYNGQLFSSALSSDITINQNSQFQKEITVDCPDTLDDTSKLTAKIFFLSNQFVPLCTDVLMRMQ